MLAPRAPGREEYRYRVIALITPFSWTDRAFLAYLVFLLLGYLFLGKGFAYVGLYPAYVAEIGLVIGGIAGLLVLVRGRLRPLARFVRVELVLLLAFLVWQAVRTVPYLSEFGLAAVRDAALWGYAAFALFIYLIVPWTRVERLIRSYGRVVPFYLGWLPLAFIFIKLRPLDIHFPGAPVPLLWLKSGEVGVHLAGAGALMLLLLDQPTTTWSRARRWILWLLWAAAWAAFSATNRAGMLSAMAGIVVVVLLRPKVNWHRPLLAIAVVLGLLYVTGFRLAVTENEEVSFRQLRDNVTSTVGWLPGGAGIAGDTSAASEGADQPQSPTMLQETAGDTSAAGEGADQPQGSTSLEETAGDTSATGEGADQPQGSTSLEETASDTFAAGEGSDQPQASTSLEETAGDPSAADEGADQPQGSTSLEETAGDTFAADEGGDQPQSSTKLQETRTWRLRWWMVILDYTLRGQYFWEGKGYGINLADDDGFQAPDHRLRSPHNVFMTILARSGVPGLILWLLFLSSFGWSLLKASRGKTRGQESQAANYALWLLAYWLAFLMNASFDVFLEGPMGGVWFWTLVGSGLAYFIRDRSLHMSIDTANQKSEVFRPTVGSEE